MLTWLYYQPVRPVLGNWWRGEGMVGLTRAFMYAGTPTVMVSLWSVSDVRHLLLWESFTGIW